ncbi:hypothetical protein DNTS_023085 [Danionella cerebrum]|uniref:PDZ domain-containing protein n=1 Tax=Danionella cerebrum TaxID=2873325 RepID=A0A553QSR8_9TELE|nr:hypothetical protein DNTS_023085 [Danionella translucida]
MVMDSVCELSARLETFSALLSQQATKNPRAELLPEQLPAEDQITSFNQRLILVDRALLWRRSREADERQDLTGAHSHSFRTHLEFLDEKKNAVFKLVPPCANSEHQTLAFSQHWSDPVFWIRAQVKRGKITVIGQGSASARSEEHRGFKEPALRMGCNMCVVNRPEEQYRIMFQFNMVLHFASLQKGNALRPIDAEVKLKGRRSSYLSQDKSSQPHEPLLLQVVRKGHRRRLGVAVGTPRLMAIADSMDNGTQTDISFQNFLNGDRGSHPSNGSMKPAPSPLIGSLVEPYKMNELATLGQEYIDANEYFNVALSIHLCQEVELYKSSQQDKLGLTVCYRTDDEEDQGIYIGEVNPNSIAAKDGRIRKGDRILQINGIEVQNREEAVAILTREDSTNFSLLLARPEIEVDPEELDCDLPVGMSVDTLNTSHLPGLYQLQQRLQAGVIEEALHRESPKLNLATLSNSQELDSGVGRTDESTKNEESSEHDILLGDDQTSASNTNATNTPGSLRKFRPGRSGGGGSDTPSPLFPLRELHFSTDSLDSGNMGGGYLHDPVSGMIMPGLTEEECERYKQLLEIKCGYEKRVKNLKDQHKKEGEIHKACEGQDTNIIGSLTPHEMAILEEEMRHLEFKCRNILRAQKMQQLRERCLKTWLMEEETSGRASAEPQGSPLHELSDITELPEKERSDKESTSAYNTGGESCRSIHTVSEHHLLVSKLEESSSPLPSRHRDRSTWSERGRASLSSSYSPSTYKKIISPMNPKFCSLSREGSLRRMPEGMIQSSLNSPTKNGGRSAESSPYFTRRRHSNYIIPERYQSCMHLGSFQSEDSRPLDRAVEGESEAPMGGSDHEGHVKGTIGSVPHPSPMKLSLALPLPLPPPSPRMEWKVKIRSDGTRYVAKRPVRDRLLKARAMKIREERSGMTTDDDAVSEMKMGRYWSKEERKQQLLKAREQRRRREFMMQSRLDYLREHGVDVGKDSQSESGQNPGSILELSQKKSSKKRNRRILDNWITIQELLAHGSRSPDGKKVYNPLLSVTTV